MKKIAHPSKPPAAVNGAVEAHYKNPLNMALRPGGKELWIACEAADSVIVVDTATEQKIGGDRGGRHAQRRGVQPGRTRAFVSNRHDDTVSVIDAAARKVVRHAQDGQRAARPAGGHSRASSCTWQTPRPATSPCSMLQSFANGEDAEREPRSLVDGASLRTARLCW